ncbi:sensor histidine kinase [Enterococcus diestrammenae]|uniref:sensor histidine kinase n=1 Tax=Enterococcus diestrammenae TaxID=1155073 RepID=UPI00195BBD68
MKVSQKLGLTSIFKWFSILLVIITIFLTFLLSKMISDDIYSEESDAVNQSISHIEDMYSEEMEKVRWMTDRLFGNSEKIESAQKFFDFEYSDYFNYIVSRSSEKPGSSFYFLPSEISGLYFEDPSLTSISFTFTQFSKVYYSNLDYKTGKVVNPFPENTGDIDFSSVILGPSNLEAMGTIKFSIDREKYTKVLKEYQNLQPVNILILSDDNQVIYKSGNNFPEKNSSHNYLIKEKEYQNVRFIGFVPKNAIIQRTVRELGLLWFVSITVISFLVFILYRLIYSYRNSISDILNTLEVVGKGNLGIRVEDKRKEPELKIISQSINQMLDNINYYVVDNYRLENEQKEANIRALQSQINPHFLYNTLEYIRMYAVNIDAVELANIVFVFSRLLRNNISQEQLISIEKEIDFCEKYTFLFKMRYPTHFDYQFYVEESVKNQVIPKFIIQPLIENYFIHGIDFKRKNNIGSVNVYRRDQRIIFEIKDNGLGIEDSRLADLKKMDFDPKELQNGKSVGIKNIYERLRLYYDGDFKFYFDRNVPTGIRVIIDIPFRKVSS